MYAKIEVLYGHTVTTVPQMHEIQYNEIIHLCQQPQTIFNAFTFVKKWVEVQNRVSNFFASIYNSYFQNSYFLKHKQYFCQLKDALFKSKCHILHWHSMDLVGGTPFTSEAVSFSWLSKRSCRLQMECMI